MAQPAPSAAQAEALTRAWLMRAVIGLNLCPFAKAPQAKGQVRFVVSPAADAQALAGHLLDELALLARESAERVETTLLIHPQALADFGEYNQFLDIADECVASLDLEGVIQVASFHPHYQFAGTEPDDVTNATNRSPYPMLHLIREDSVARAVAAYPEAERVVQANLATMQRLGAAGWAALQQQCRDDAAEAG